MKKGLFITVEGGDGSGKTTLIKNLHRYLGEKGIGSIVTREPGSTEIGNTIREMVLGPKFIGKMANMTETLLFLSSRAQHIEDLIEPSLNEGKIVLCDRFNDSTIVYQGLGRGLGFEEVKKLCRLACQGVEPDLTFLLDIPPEYSLQRLTGEADRIEREKIEFHHMVRDGYLTLADQDPNRFHVLNSLESKEDLFEQARQVLDNRI
jgi:dTMP kinase